MDVPGVCFETIVSREDVGCLDRVWVMLGRSDGESDIAVDGGGRSTADVVTGWSTIEVVSARREVNDSARLEDILVTRCVTVSLYNEVTVVKY